MKHNLAWFLAGMVATAAITTGVAEARRHHGAHCRLGLIYVRHAGECVSRKSAARAGIIRAPRIRVTRSIRRHQKVYYATVQVPADEPEAPPPTPPTRPPVPEVIASCGTADPQPYGWPGRWVVDKGLKRHKASWEF